MKIARPVLGPSSKRAQHPNGHRAGTFLVLGAHEADAVFEFQVVVVDTLKVAIEEIDAFASSVGLNETLAFFHV